MNHIQQSSTRVLKYLVIIATIISGWLAGATVDRFIVQFPAFSKIDITNWVNFSHHADLGNGIFLYPFEAIVPFLCLIVSAIMVSGKNTILSDIRVLIYISLVLSFMGLFFTVFAAPQMLALNHIEFSPCDFTSTGNYTRSIAQEHFDRFYFWSAFRAIVQVLLFFPCLWAFGKIWKLRN